MLTSDLFKQVLIQPIENGADELLVVSGYASPAMAMHHMVELQKGKHDIPIGLIVGMTAGGREGINKIQHKAFQKLTTGVTVKGKEYNGPFTCNYLVSGDPCHAKIYIWMRDGTPIMALTGSANYTQNGFGGNQIETVTATDPMIAKALYDRLLANCLVCTDNEIDQKIRIAEASIEQVSAATEPSEDLDFEEDQHIILPLLQRHNNKVHDRAGLNWGQRPGRDRNQAYIPIPKRIRDRYPDFFPPLAEQFTVLTDDGESFIMAVSQQQEKALETTESNALLGRYFRNRMGLKSGEKVTEDHLREYGRMAVDFYRIEPGTYLMDFSPNPELAEAEYLWD